MVSSSFDNITEHQLKFHGQKSCFLMSTLLSLIVENFHEKREEISPDRTRATTQVYLLYNSSKV